MKKILMSVVLVITCFLLTGCLESEVPEKEFSANGFSITLNENFYEKDLMSVTNYYESEKVIVTALKEEFSLLEMVGLNSNSTLQEYAEVVKLNNKADYTFALNEENNYVYFNYNATVNAKDFYYYGVIKKGSDSFWLINFACLEEEKDEYQPKFEKWAATIEVE